QSAQELLTLTGPGMANGVAFSPDGRRLAVAWKNGGVRMWDGGPARKTFKFQGTPSSWPQAVAFSPDGERLVIAANEPSTHVWALHTGRPLLALERPTGPGVAIEFHPDGTTFALGLSRSVVLCDSASGRVRLAIQPQPHLFTTFAFVGDQVA